MNLDADLPALIPEIIAEAITQDQDAARRMCARARLLWETNAGFRRSFRRKDERDVLTMWFRHWSDGEILLNN
jgi:hypothetical protein